MVDVLHGLYAEWEETAAQPAAEQAAAAADQPGQQAGLVLNRRDDLGVTELTRHGRGHFAKDHHLR